MIDENQTRWVRPASCEANPLVHIFHSQAYGPANLDFPVFMIDCCLQFKFPARGRKLPNWYRVWSVCNRFIPATIQIWTDELLSFSQVLATPGDVEVRLWRICTLACLT